MTKKQILEDRYSAQEWELREPTRAERVDAAMEAGLSWAQADEYASDNEFAAARHQQRCSAAWRAADWFASAYSAHIAVDYAANHNLELRGSAVLAALAALDEWNPDKYRVEPLQGLGSGRKTTLDAAAYDAAIREASRDAKVRAGLDNDGGLYLRVQVDVTDAENWGRTDDPVWSRRLVLRIRLTEESCARHNDTLLWAAWCRLETWAKALGAGLPAPRHVQERHCWDHQEVILDGEDRVCDDIIVARRRGGGCVTHRPVPEGVGDSSIDRQIQAWKDWDKDWEDDAPNWGVYFDAPVPSGRRIAASRLCKTRMADPEDWRVKNAVIVSGGFIRVGAKGEARELYLDLLALDIQCEVRHI